MTPSRSGLLHGGALHRCMLVLTFLLLVCEVVISRLCNSLINMMDGFHTLFVLMHMALPHPQTTNISSTRKASHKPSVSSPSSPHAHFSLSTLSSTSSYPPLTTTPTESPIKSTPSIQATHCESPNPSSSPSLHPPTPDPTPVHTAPSQASSNKLTPTTTLCSSIETLYSNYQISHSSAALSNSATLQPLSPSHLLSSQPSSLAPLAQRCGLSHSHLLSSQSSYLAPLAQRCGLSYSSLRIQPVGAFISALLLASLCVSVCMEILSDILQPHPVQRPLLATAVGALSLVHNLLVLGLSWGQLLGRSGALWNRETRSHLEMNGKVKAKEQTKENTEEGCADDAGTLPSAVAGSFQEGSLVLCNPGASSVLDPDSDSQDQTQKPPPSPLGVRLRTAVSQGFPSKPCYRAHTLPIDPDKLRPDSRFSEVSNSSPDTEANNQNESPVLKSDQPIESLIPRTPRSGCFPSLIAATQALLCSILALTSGLVLLLAGPDCPHSSGSCSLLVYLDPAFSLVAVIVLLAIALPQVYRYSLLLLQASPPQICVPDLGRRIASVPGVLAVHDLHVWQLTDTCTVASVHVHCHAEFQSHRCDDLISGVTKVLQSEGVSCCTVQPEMLPSSPTTNGSSPPVIHREIPSLPSVLACSRACGKNCAEKMCCSPPLEETRELLAPPAGETEEEPQTLVIENTFL